METYFNDGVNHPQMIGLATKDLTKSWKRLMENFCFIEALWSNIKNVEDTVVQLKSLFSQIQFFSECNRWQKIYITSLKLIELCHETNLEKPELNRHIIFILSSRCFLEKLFNERNEQIDQEDFKSFKFKLFSLNSSLPVFYFS